METLETNPMFYVGVFFLIIALFGILFVKTKDFKKGIL